MSLDKTKKRCSSTYTYCVYYIPSGSVKYVIVIINSICGGQFVELCSSSGRSSATTHLTATSWEPRWAEALEAVNLVVATAAVEARLADTLVQVFLTALASKTRSAHALETIHQVLNETNDEAKDRIHYNFAV